MTGNHVFTDSLGGSVCGRGTDGVNGQMAAKNKWQIPAASDKPARAREILCQNHC